MYCCYLFVSVVLIAHREKQNRKKAFKDLLLIGLVWMNLPLFRFSPVSIHLLP